MVKEDYNWRIAGTEAGLANGAMIARGIPVPLQPEPVDHTVRRSRSAGGTAHHGYNRYRLLWRNLDEHQARSIRELVGDVRIAKLPLYLTTVWWDETNPVARWVDMRGEPDLENMAIGPPVSGFGMWTYSTVVLTLNNVSIVNDPASF